VLLLTTPAWASAQNGTQNGSDTISEKRARSSRLSARTERLAEGAREDKGNLRTNASELEIKVSKRGIKVELESNFPEKGTHKGREVEGRALCRESKTKAEVKGNTTEVEVELPSAEYKLKLNTTQQ